MHAHSGRRLYLTSIAALALGLVGTCGAAMYRRSGPSLEERAAQLVPADGTVLVAETRDDHRYVVFMRGSVLTLCVVHPTPAMGGCTSTAGTLMYNSADVIYVSSSRSMPQPNVDCFVFTIDRKYGTELTV